MLCFMTEDGPVPITEMTVEQLERALGNVLRDKAKIRIRADVKQFFQTLEDGLTAEIRSREERARAN